MNACSAAANGQLEKSNMTTEEIEAGLNSPFARVRRKFAERTDYTPTAEQIDRGLKDKNGSIRRAFAEREDFVPNAEQIERGLTDKYYRVRYAFSERDDIRLTSEQIERGLRDPSVIFAFVGRRDYTPTFEQIERALKDESWEIRRRFACRQDIQLTKEQFHRAINEVGAIATEVAGFEKYDLTMTKRQIESQLYELENPFVERFIRLTKNTLTKEQIAYGLEEYSLYAKVAIINRPEFVPTKKQIEDGIKNAASEEERQAWRAAIARSAAAQVTTLPSTPRSTNRSL